MALNFSCSSVFKDNENARVVSLGPLGLRRESAGKEEIFDLDVPYPYLLETAPPPWFSHTQILKTGVGQGLGTSSADVYLLLLDGIELVSFYNKAIVGRADATDYIEDAMNVKKIILKLSALKKTPHFPALSSRGVIWASKGFEFLLCGALDEAYAISETENVIKTREITLMQMKIALSPVLWYNKVHSLFNLRVVPFRDGCEKNALFCCFIFALTKKHAPWRIRRETKYDTETASVLQALGKELAAYRIFSETMGHFSDQAALFVDMVKINSALPVVDVTKKLYSWAEEVGANSIIVSKASQLFSQP